MSRLPIRLRVTAAFALAMAVVLAGSGWFLYSRLGSHLEFALNRHLDLRSRDLPARVRQPGAWLENDNGGRFAEHGESYAELVDSRGRVLDATPGVGRTALLTQAELRAAERGPIFARRSSTPGLDEPSRLLATPVERSGRRIVLVVGATAQNRAEALNSFRDELLIAGPIALVLASLFGYFLAGLSLPHVESVLRPAPGISTATPGGLLPVPIAR